MSQQVATLGGVRGSTDRHGEAGGYDSRNFLLQKQSPVGLEGTVLDPSIPGQSHSGRWGAGLAKLGAQREQWTAISTSQSIMVGRRRAGLGVLGRHRASSDVREAGACSLTRSPCGATPSPAATLGGLRVQDAQGQRGAYSA